LAALFPAVEVTPILGRQPNDRVRVACLRNKIIFWWPRHVRRRSWCQMRRTHVPLSSTSLHMLALLLRRCWRAAALAQTNKRKCQRITDITTVTRAGRPMPRYW